MTYIICTHTRLNGMSACIEHKLPRAAPKGTPYKKCMMCGLTWNKGEQTPS